METRSVKNAAKSTTIEISEGLSTNANIERMLREYDDMNAEEKREAYEAALVILLEKESELIERSKSQESSDKNLKEVMLVEEVRAIISEQFKFYLGKQSKRSIVPAESSSEDNEILCKRKSKKSSRTRRESSSSSKSSSSSDNRPSPKIFTQSAKSSRSFKSSRELSSQAMKTFPQFREDDVLFWFKRVDMWRQAYSVSDDQVVNCLMEKADHKTQKWLYHQQVTMNNLTWKKLQELLRKRFRLTEIGQLAQRFFSRKQRIDEKAADYAVEKLTLLSEIDPKASEESKVDYLRQGLLPSVREKVVASKMTCTQEFISLLEDIDAIKVGEASRQGFKDQFSRKQVNNFTIDGQSSSSSSASKTNKSSKPNFFNKSDKKVATSPSGKWQSTNNVQSCEFCGKNNHSSKFCWLNPDGPARKSVIQMLERERKDKDQKESSQEN